MYHFNLTLYAYILMHNFYQNSNLFWIVVFFIHILPLLRNVFHTIFVRNYLFIFTCKTYLYLLYIVNIYITILNPFDFQCNPCSNKYLTSALNVCIELNISTTISQIIISLRCNSYPVSDSKFIWLTGSKHFNIELREVIFGCCVTNTYDDETMSPDVDI